LLHLQRLNNKKIFFLATSTLLQVPVPVPVPSTTRLPTSGPAIAGKPRCSVYKFWQKYIGAKIVHLTSLYPSVGRYHGTSFSRYCRYWLFLFCCCCCCCYCWSCCTTTTTVTTTITTRGGFTGAGSDRLPPVTVKKRKGVRRGHPEYGT